MNTTTTAFAGRFAGNLARNVHNPLFPRDIFGIPMFFIWNLLIVLIVVLIFYWILRGSRQVRETPMDLLKKRYVLGEIDKETFEEMKKTIGD
jgi:uncharacterized membrane protein